MFIDHDSIEEELEKSWRYQGFRRRPSFTGADGTKLEIPSKHVWFDAPRRLRRCRHGIIATWAEGEVIHKECEIQKHPASALETQSWLLAHGFAIESLTDSVGGPPWESGDGRVTFWVRKKD